MHFLVTDTIYTHGREGGLTQKVAVLPILANTRHVHQIYYTHKVMHRSEA